MAFLVSTTDDISILHAYRAKLSLRHSDPHFPLNFQNIACLPEQRNENNEFPEKKNQTIVFTVNTLYHNGQFYLIFFKSYYDKQHQERAKITRLGFLENSSHVEHSDLHVRFI